MLTMVLKYDRNCLPAVIGPSGFLLSIIIIAGFGQSGDPAKFHLKVQDKAPLEQTASNRLQKDPYGAKLLSQIRKTAPGSNVFPEKKRPEPGRCGSKHLRRF